jgi:serine/threonine protein kinase, bacterial
VVLTVVGVIAYARQPTKGTASAASAPAASTPARPAAVLDGTYRFDYDYEKQTINGAPYAIHTTDNTGWWAFRSSCGSTGCVATATQLDTNNHHVARTPAQPADYRFVEGHCGNPRPFSANLPSRAASEQTDKSSQALIPSC